MLDTPEGLRVPLLRTDRTIAAYALLSVEDAALADLHWYRDPNGYARRSVGRGSQFLHHAVLGTAPGNGREVDHINRDKLDNRRENLRIVSRSEQMQNVPSRGGTSGHRGVSLHRLTGKWRANAKLNGQLHFLGLFTTEDEAAKVAREWRRDHMPFATE